MENTQKNNVNKFASYNLEDNFVINPEFKKFLETTDFAVRPLTQGDDEYILKKYPFDDKAQKVDRTKAPERYEVTLTCMATDTPAFMSDYTFVAYDIDSFDGFRVGEIVNVRMTDEFVNRKVGYRFERTPVAKLVKKQ